jgi:hypothetical protein
MGVDSGLPDFRGPEGCWKACPPFRHRLALDRSIVPLLASRSFAAGVRRGLGGAAGQRRAAAGRWWLVALVDAVDDRDPRGVTGA